MSGTSLGSPNPSWALVALLAQTRISVTSYCVCSSRLGTVADTEPHEMLPGQQGAAPSCTHRWIQPHRCRL